MCCCSLQLQLQCTPNLAKPKGIYSRDWWDNWRETVFKIMRTSSVVLAAMTASMFGAECMKPLPLTVVALKGSGGSILVWGVITTLHHYLGRQCVSVTARKYCDILSEHFVPFGNNHLPANYIFMQDNAYIHSHTRQLQNDRKTGYTIARLHSGLLDSVKQRETPEPDQQRTLELKQQTATTPLMPLRKPSESNALRNCQIRNVGAVCDRVGNGYPTVIHDPSDPSH